VGACLGLAQETLGRLINRYKGLGKKFAKFCLTGLGGFLIAYSLLYVLTEYAHFWYMWSALMAQVAATAWNFTLSLKWVFK
jgi:putative flippase GtrA